MLKKFLLIALSAISFNACAYNTDLLVAKNSGSGITISLHNVTRCLHPKAPCRMCNHHRTYLSPKYTDFDTFFKTPHKALQENKTIQDKLHEKYKTSAEQFEFFNMKYDLENNGLALLSENATDSDEFNRVKHPQRRSFCEEKTLKQIALTHQNKQRPLVYTSINRGKLFSDAVMLNSIVRKGYTNIHINIIDEQLFEYIKTVKQALPADGAVCFRIEQTTAQKTIETALCTYRFAQFLWLLNNITEKHITAQKHIKTAITLTLYADAQDYLNACNNHRAERSDIMVTEFGTNVEADADMLTELMRDTLSYRGLAIAYCNKAAKPEDATALNSKTTCAIFRVTHQRIPAQGNARNDIQRIRIYDVHDMDKQDTFNLKKIFG